MKFVLATTVLLAVVVAQAWAGCKTHWGPCLEPGQRTKTMKWFHRKAPNDYCFKYGKAQKNVRENA